MQVVSIADLKENQTHAFLTTPKMTCLSPSQCSESGFKPTEGWVINSWIRMKRNLINDQASRREMAVYSGLSISLRGFAFVESGQCHYGGNRVG